MPGLVARSGTVHPMAWWGWAFGMAIATTRSPGVISTGLLIAALVLVVAICHGDSPFARAFPAYLGLAAAIVAIRVVFYILVGIKGGTGFVVSLPTIPLPNWAGGIELLGPVSGSGLMAAFSAGLALAALLLCFGAAIALTDPRRTLRSLPASLHLLGTATVIAMTLAPQLVESWQRVRRAQKLRGQRLRRAHSVSATTSPVLQDALERSLKIAASMDSRGYARLRSDARGGGGGSHAVLALMIAALMGAALGTYALMDGTTPQWLSVSLLVGGAAAAVLGSVIASRRVQSTRYRPDPWGTREMLITVSGMAVAALAFFSADVASPGTAGWSAAFLLGAVLATSPIPVVMAR